MAEGRLPPQPVQGCSLRKLSEDGVEALLGLLRVLDPLEGVEVRDVIADDDHRNHP